MNEEQRQAALLVVVTGVLMAASALRLENGFAPGRIPCDAARDAARPRPQRRNGAGGGARHRACHGSDGAAGELPPRGGLRLRCAFDRGSAGDGAWARRCCGACRSSPASLPLDAEQGLILLYEGLCATLLFLVLPNRLFGGKRLAAEKPEADTAETEEAERSTARRRLSATALARELYDSLMRTPKAEDENPAMIFDRAAERVCRGCSLRTICWGARLCQDLQRAQRRDARAAHAGARARRRLSLVFYGPLHPLSELSVGGQQRAERLPAAAAVPRAARRHARAGGGSTPSSPSCSAARRKRWRHSRRRRRRC